MATPNIVPRADSEGGLGTASKYWASAYIDTITTTSHVNLPDSAELRLGTGNDFRLYHNGNDSYVNNGTGSLYIKSTTSDSDIIFQGSDGGSSITALTLDMSAAGTATFNNAGIFASSNASGYTTTISSASLSSANHLNIQADASYLTLDGGDVSTIIHTIKVMMPNLPTSDPSVAGQLWNSSGDLKISAG